MEVDVFVLLAACSVSEGDLGLNEIGGDGAGQQVGPWAEIYNASSSTASFEGWTVSLDGEDWVVGEVSVSADSMTVLHLDGDPSAGAAHAPFSLAPEGGILEVRDPEGELQQEIHVPELEPGAAWGRKPDGAANWQIIDSPSPGGFNDAS